MVSLNQIPSKIIVMDVVVAYVPPKFGILLYRFRASKLKETLKIDMSYATIMMFGD